MAPRKKSKTKISSPATPGLQPGTRASADLSASFRCKLLGTRMMNLPEDDSRSG